jgi:hypothetical protein
MTFIFEKKTTSKSLLSEKKVTMRPNGNSSGTTRPNSVYEQPVDLTVLYPTLLELCGLVCLWTKESTASVVSLLRNPKAKRERSALMTYQRGNHADRSDRWRYIQYADGSEELYDHETDPNEWNNLANDPWHKKLW